jgi:ABC-type transport system involved in cytochrome c biogenesis permease subunit
MSETLPHLANPSRDPKQAAPPGLWEGLRHALAPLASLRITVVLFALSLVLVFCGTLAQKDIGNDNAVHTYFRSFYVWIPLQIFFAHSYRVSGGFPYPGGYIIGGALLINVLGAYIVRFRWNWRRAGILVLHAGVILLLVGELLTDRLAVEGRMSIEEGGSSSYLEDHKKVELAVIDPSDPKSDNVVAVPVSHLRPGGILQEESLPFDVEVQRYMTNSSMEEEIPAGAANPATAGDGRFFLAVERPEVSGTEVNGAIDLPSAYVTFYKKGTTDSLGTYLLSTWLSVTERPNQKVEVNGKTYEVSLRFQRRYKPYTIVLDKFTHDLYPGTDIPKDYASQVRLYDSATGEQREVRIWMNHPLRYHGETFYQSGVLPGDKGTILQVVRNPSWQLPYYACALVSLGMLFHFLLGLERFLAKVLAAARVPGPGGQPEAALEEPALLPSVPVAPRKGTQFTAQKPTAVAGGISTATAVKKATAQRARAAKSLPPKQPNGLVRFIPWIAAGLALLYFLAVMLPPADAVGKFQLQEFGSLPIVDRGRVKPLDTFARVSLLIISNKQDFQDDKGNTQPAIKWLLDVMTSRAAEQYQVFRIENDQVRDLLKLKERPGLRYSVAELGPKVEVLLREAERASRLDDSKRDKFDGKILELKKKLETYFAIAEFHEPLVLPPQSGGQEWQSLRQAAVSRKSGRENVNARAFGELLGAYSQDDPERFNKALANFRERTGPLVAGQDDRAGFEVFFNNFQPFLHSSIFYVLIFLIGCVSWVTWREPLRRTAFVLAVITLLVHTFALVGRMYIQNRWLVMVTNLYSSAIFIGWVALLASLILEAIFRNGIPLVAGACIGAVTMLIAHLLATGDTLEVLQAVLDTNFWLATHVTSITIGYSATFLAGFLGMAYIFCGGLRLIFPKLDSTILKSLNQMIYGVICFATLFSFTGTVLGGIWADQSWGRFWGWDSKENGALLIVIWNVLILHARWSGLIKAPGMAVMAVVGNVVTSWSWFGTNMLGVGLHSYGFMAGAVWGLVGAVLFFLSFAGVGFFLPKRAWR